MMTVTHGVVSSLNIQAVDSFEVQASSFIVGDALQFDIYADIGDVIRTDYGDGNEVLTAILTSPQTISGNTISTVNLVIKSNGNVNRIKFLSATNNYEAVNLILSSTITSAAEICRGLSNLTSFAMDDSSSVTTFNFAWATCSSLTSFPLLSTASLVDISSAWRDCSALISFPLIDTSSITDFTSTWSGCFGLTSFPLLDTSLVTDFVFTWFACSSLTSFPLIDTSEGTIFFGTWQSCAGLTSFPLIDTSSGTDFTSTWRDCLNLVCLSSVNTLLQTTTTNIFAGSTLLANPTPTEQTQIESGFNYVNGGACP